MKKSIINGPKASFSNFSSKVDHKSYEQLSWPREWERPRDNKHPKNPGQCMYEYCFYGLWYDGKGSQVNMKSQLELYIKLGGTKERRERDKKFADKWLEEARNILKKPDGQDKESGILGGPLSYHIQQKRKDDAERKQREITIRNHKVNIKPAIYKNTSPQISTFARGERTIPKYEHHPNDIVFLPPAKHWYLYIDESYYVKSGNDSDSSFKEGGDGVIGGILFSAENQLPPTEALHMSTDATEEKLTKADKLIEKVIHSQCGVLALPVRVYKSPQGWGSVIAAYIDLVLRLLPLNGKCRVDVRVEQRDTYKETKDLTPLSDACRFHLMHSLPERASQIDLNVEIQDKTDPYNSYPDAIAHTCRMRNSTLGKPRFQQSAWDGSCFLNYPAEELSRVLDLFYSGKEISPEDWDILLQTADSKKNCFLEGLLQAIGHEAQANLRCWQKYLDYTVQHLNSKAINQRRLQNQLNWLTCYAPEEDSNLPPRLRLLWLTTKLAEANHKGAVNAFPHYQEEFMNLSKKLFEEDAPLVCHAALNLAVSFTDEYQFEKAKALLAPWKEYHPEVPGLQYYGRLLSSFGQHEAFLGNPEEAATYFRTAIQAFKRLSDRESAYGDIQQTTTYLLTCLMDTQPFDERAFRMEAESFFASPIAEVIPLLSISDADKEKYAHHLLLRYLVSGHAAESEKQQYLSTKAEWKTGEGHPWEIIEFYRALLSDPEEKIARLRNAYNIAQQGKGTMHVIACVILGAVLLEHPEKENDYRLLIEQCAKEIPALGSRLEILRKHITQKYAPLELAKQILPFNFR